MCNALIIKIIIFFRRIIYATKENILPAMRETVIGG